MQLTQSGFNRAVADFRKIAGEQVDVEFFSNTFYVYGSEVATLRLLKKYRTNEAADAGILSKNTGCFYFRLEVPTFSGEFVS